MKKIDVHAADFFKPFLYLAYFRLRRRPQASGPDRDILFPLMVMVLIMVRFMIMVGIFGIVWHTSFTSGTVRRSH